MKDPADDLIERLERETGQCLEENNGNNFVMSGLLGALSRLMGQSPPSYQECDDVAAGEMLCHQMSPEYWQEQVVKAMIADMLASGMSPEDAKALTG